MTEHRAPTGDAPGLPGDAPGLHSPVNPGSGDVLTCPAASTAAEILSPSKAETLRNLLFQDRILRGIGVHDGFTALLADRHPFDALWLSGLGVSAAHGIPDASILAMSEFLAAARLADRSSRMPVIADCDTGFGDVNTLVHVVREYERAGIAAICIEDKQFPKRNSFTGGQRLADPYEFAAKIGAAKQAQRTRDFMLIARIESLVAGAGQNDAMARAELYVDAGADSILIHSKSSSAEEVLAFTRRFRVCYPDTFLVVVPTTYPSVREAQLRDAGVSLVIYANQVLRAFAAAGDRILATIAREGTTAGVEPTLMGIYQLVELLGSDVISATDEWFELAAERLRSLREDMPRLAV